MCREPCGGFVAGEDTAKLSEPCPGLTVTHRRGGEVIPSPFLIPFLTRPKWLLGQRAAHDSAASPTLSTWWETCSPQATLSFGQSTAHLELLVPGRLFLALVSAPAWLCSLFSSHRRCWDSVLSAHLWKVGCSVAVLQGASRVPPSGATLFREHVVAMPRPCTAHGDELWSCALQGISSPLASAAHPGFLSVCKKGGWGGGVAGTSRHASHSATVSTT